MMKSEKYALITRLLHGLCALLIIALFISGWIMVDLDYYSPWYTTLPEWHILAGVVLLLMWAMVIVRLFLPKKHLTPLNHKPWERLAAQTIKYLFYALITVIIVCGYLFTTADGESKEVMGWLNLPAFSQFTADQIDTMGWLHENLSYVVMVLLVFHVLGALKHHFIDKDNTLKRML